MRATVHSTLTIILCDEREMTYVTAAGARCQEKVRGQAFVVGPQRLELSVGARDDTLR